VSNPFGSILWQAPHLEEAVHVQEIDLHLPIIIVPTGLSCATAGLIPMPTFKNDSLIRWLKCKHQKSLAFISLQNGKNTTQPG